MVFYHGSNHPIENNLLLKDYREDKTIYLTDEYTMAVFCMGKSDNSSIRLCNDFSILI